ncbi:hypothetical protein FGO68_gene16678 [Halteria grandinella]|uniref:Uncharacterized protein n=1 Tax=Halteria grandinella TaxID=5974 RepID=A0A8J8T8X0_HALGN|nr:hypothetical protein FGO68_gene16678 [Halteria grandinella]
MIPKAKISSSSVSKNKRPTEKMILSQFIKDTPQPISPGLPPKKVPPRAKQSAQSVLYGGLTVSKSKRVLEEKSSERELTPPPPATKNRKRSDLDTSLMGGSFQGRQKTLVPIEEVEEDKDKINRRYQEFLDRSKSAARQRTQLLLKKTKTIRTMIKGLSIKGGAKSQKGGK